ncbi:MAG: LysR family transcriptional regulator [Steroidobacteraceae bacterium]|nr:LysR family transcriptional regulator [Steroidobacteraceae bacterium]
MELRQLRHFLAVVDHGSFSRAAQMLGKSQQALSKSIHALEQSLGVRLLDRNPRASALTAFGQLLLPFARNIDLEATSFRERLTAVRRAERGRVRLGASPASATQLVTEAVLRLAATQPELQIAVLSGIFQGMERELLAGELDLFVCIDNDDDVTEGVAREVLLDDEYRVVCAITHPLAKAKAVTAMQLTQYGWILGRNLGEIEQAWRRAFEQAELPVPEPVVETTSIEFCKHALQAGNYLSVLPAQLIETELEQEILCQVEAPDFRWLRPIALHYRRSGTLSPAVLAVIDSLHRAAGRYQRRPPA